MSSGEIPFLLQIVFMISTLLVAVPTGVKIFSWLGTIWGGKLSFETPMLFTLGAIVIFLLGGLTGPFQALVPTDLYLHETYWVVSHFHQTMFGGFVFPFFAAIYFWFPKVTGRMYNERWGKVHFWLMVPAFCPDGRLKLPGSVHMHRSRIVLVTWRKLECPRKTS